MSCEIGLGKGNLAEQADDRRGELPFRRRLDPVCDWFTQGFDLPDLRDARALLDEL